MRISSQSEILQSFVPLSLLVIVACYDRGHIVSANAPYRFEDVSLRLAVNQWLVNRNDAESFYGPIKMWNVSCVTTMSYLFFQLSTFDGDISQWDVSKVISMNSMFRGASYFNGDISRWNVSSVMDMAFMFHDASTFNGDVSQWDISRVNDMTGMFMDAHSFHGDISRWDVSSVTDMGFLFYTSGSSSLNRDISLWNVSNVTDMSYMFYTDGATSTFNANIFLWDVRKVKDMTAMFHGTSFGGDISEWNISRVASMANMFSGAIYFHGDISQWDVSNVTDMSWMFSFTSFNGNISQWNVSNVSDMSWMFSYTFNFNGNITQWNVNRVVNMSYMFYNATSFHQSLCWNASYADTFRIFESSGSDANFLSYPSCITAVPSLSAPTSKKSWKRSSMPDHHSSNFSSHLSMIPRISSSSEKHNILPYKNSSTKPSVHPFSESKSRSTFEMVMRRKTPSLCPVDTFNLKILLDDWPEETTWALTDVISGSLLSSGGPYDPILARNTIEESICVNMAKCLEFKIYDGADDGIWSIFSVGYYQLSLNGVVVATGGKFKNSALITAR